MRKKNRTLSIVSRQNPNNSKIYNWEHTLSNDDEEEVWRNAGAKALVNAGALANERRQMTQDFSVEIISNRKNFLNESWKKVCGLGRSIVMWLAWVLDFRVGRVESNTTTNCRQTADCEGSPVVLTILEE